MPSSKRISNGIFIGAIIGVLTVFVQTYYLGEYYWGSLFQFEDWFYGSIIFCPRALVLGPIGAVLFGVIGTILVGRLGYNR